MTKPPAPASPAVTPTPELYRLAPEATYNRGIALARLGRRADAVSALRPFADGAFGDYRRKEARKLIDALDR